MPNLENLRKQAKQLLHWHRARDYTVAPQIRAFLPRYRHLNDEQVLAHSFKLSHAQELVARREGFDSWLALKEGISTVSPDAPMEPGTPRLVGAEPQLFVSSIKAATEFYSRLGFEPRFIYGDPPFYAQVYRDGARLNLRHVDGPVFDATFRARERDALSATVIVDDVKALFLQYLALDVDFHQSLEAEPWGTSGFIVVDPDRNLVYFASGGA